VTITSANVVSLYVDGILNSSATSPSGPASTNGDVYIGQFGGGSFYYSGLIDEVAIWNKVLNATEILQLYRRGANRIRYQVRSCPDSICSSNPAWQGPDSTNQTYFSELNNNAVPSDGGDLTSSDSVQATLPTMTFSAFGALTLTPNRYFQYRAIMESDDSSTSCNYGSGPTWCSPELQAVSVMAH
jgi:hypothetical protein